MSEERKTRNIKARVVIDQAMSEAFQELVKSGNREGLEDLIQILEKRLGTIKKIRLM
jgi:hypothetical protein